MLAKAPKPRGPAAAVHPQPTEVQVAPVQQRDVPVYQEWIGALDGLVNAYIKAEVSGYLVEQVCKEGSFAGRCQLLFQIDPRPFQAALDQAQGRLAQSQGQTEQARTQLAQAQVAVAEANQRRTQLDVDGYTPLVERQAITQQDLDIATQNNIAAKAQVETARAQITAAEASVQSAKAAVDTARINLGFTRLTAPIDGIPGIAQQTDQRIAGLSDYLAAKRTFLAWIRTCVALTGLAFVVADLASNARHGLLSEWRSFWRQADWPWRS